MTVEHVLGQRVAPEDERFGCLQFLIADLETMKRLRVRGDISLDLAEAIVKRCVFLCEGLTPLIDFAHEEARRFAEMPKIGDAR